MSQVFPFKVHLEIAGKGNCKLKENYLIMVLLNALIFTVDGKVWCKLFLILDTVIKQQ